MKVFFVGQLAKLREVRKLRAVMRGYRRLKKAGQLGRVRRLKRELAGEKIEGMDSAVSSLIFGAGVESATRVVQQYVLTRIGGIGLNKA